MSSASRETDILAAERALSKREATVAIAMDLADVAPGARAVATKFGLVFISLGCESFDFVLPRRTWFQRLYQDLVSRLRSWQSQELADELTGYDLSACRQLLWGDN